MIVIGRGLAPVNACYPDTPNKVGLNEGCVRIPTLKQCPKYRTVPFWAKPLGQEHAAIFVGGQSFILLAFQVGKTLGSNHVVVCCPDAKNGNFGTYQDENSIVSAHWLCT